MKSLKMMSLFAILLLVPFLFNACNDTTSTTSEAPQITSLSPTSGSVGTVVTIRGTGFGLGTDEGTVKFGTVEVSGKVGQSGSDYVTWSDTEIKVKVPANAVPGANSVTVYNGSTKKTSNAVTFTVGDAGKVKNLMANSPSSTEIKLKWTPVAGIDGYNLYQTVDGNLTKVTSVSIAKSDSTVVIKNLSVGKEYTFKLCTYTGGITNEDLGAEVKWATSFKYEGVKIYETKSTTYPSGARLSDGQTMMISESAEWDICLDTKSDTVEVCTPKASAMKIQIPKATLVDTVIGARYASSIDDVFESVLFGATHGTSEIWRTTVDESETSGWYFFVKTQEGNYAKVYVRRENGKFLQGSYPDRYITVDISYQDTKTLPYAGIKPSDKNYENAKFMETKALQNYKVKKSFVK